jgi:hypothetical protein
MCNSEQLLNIQIHKYYLIFISIDEHIYLRDSNQRLYHIKTAVASDLNKLTSEIIYS